MLCFHDVHMLCNGRPMLLCAPFEDRFVCGDLATKFSDQSLWPRGVPWRNNIVENGCMTQMVSNVLTLDRHTYAAICDVMEALLEECCKSANAACTVAPWIMCAVQPKSGRIQKPVRRASMPVCLFTFQVLDFRLNG